MFLDLTLIQDDSRSSDGEVEEKRANTEASSSKKLPSAADLFDSVKVPTFLKATTTELDPSLLVFKKSNPTITKKATSAEVNETKSTPVSEGLPAVAENRASKKRAAAEALDPVHERLRVAKQHLDDKQQKLAAKRQKVSAKDKVKGQV